MPFYVFQLSRIFLRGATLLPLNIVKRWLKVYFFAEQFTLLPNTLPKSSVSIYRNGEAEGRDVVKGGGEGVPPPPPPLGVFGPPAEGPKLRRKQPRSSQKSRNVCGNRQKSTSGKSISWQSPSDHLGPPEKRTPVTIGGSSNS